jgi:hypothetical protein
MSDGEKREIVINPEHFKISSNNTRKRRESGANNSKIKVNAPVKREKKAKASTLKRNLVKMLRNYQDDQMKKQQHRKQPGSAPSAPIEDTVTELPSQSDFESSVNFFKSLEKAREQETKERVKNKGRSSTNTTQPARHNYTLRSERSSSPIVLPVQTTMPEVPMENLRPVTPPLSSSSMNPVIQVQPPPYGCLKNGNLPTYRTWKRTTQRNYPSSTVNKQTPPPMSSSTSIIKPSPVQVNYQTQLRDKIRTMSLQQQLAEKNQKSLNASSSVNHGNWRKPKKQKRTIRRTYRTGKSKVHPHVAVLVSNKTIRNNTNLKMTKLKETPITEVKRFLKKQGFIKVNSNTPNDVLRQMYECTNLICGEVKNHNSENLLYNYFHDTE